MLLREHQSHWSQPAISFENFLITDKHQHYQHVSIQGHFDLKHSFLLDNQSHDQQQGYHLMIPFVVEDHPRTVLVDCGWLPHQKPTEDTIHHFIPKGTVTLSGHIFLIQHRPFQLSQHLQTSKSYPMIIQGIDLPELSHIINSPLYPFTFLVDREVPVGCIKDWTQLLKTPYRHIGYTIQFAILAMLLVTIFVASHTRRIK